MTTTVKEFTTSDGETWAIPAGVNLVVSNSSSALRRLATALPHGPCPPSMTPTLRQAIQSLLGRIWNTGQDGSALKALRVVIKHPCDSVFAQLAIMENSMLTLLDGLRWTDEAPADGVVALHRAGDGIPPPILRRILVEAMPKQATQGGAVVLTSTDRVDLMSILRRQTHMHHLDDHVFVLSDGGESIVSARTLRSSPASRLSMDDELLEHAWMSGQLTGV